MINEPIPQIVENQHESLFNRLQRILGPTTLEIAFFISRLTKIDVPGGCILLHQDQVCNAIYFVEHGLLRSFLTIDEKQVNTEFFLNGDFAGAFSSFVLKKNTSLCIEAIEDSKVWIIPEEMLEEMYRRNPLWLAVGKFIFETEFIKKCQRESSFLQDNAKQRYLKFIAQNPLIEQRVTLKHIASYLGIEPETLSRIRSGRL